MKSTNHISAVQHSGLVDMQALVDASATSPAPAATKEPVVGSMNQKIIACDTGCGLHLEYVDLNLTEHYRAPYSCHGALLEILAMESLSATNRVRDNKGIWNEENIASGLSCNIHHDVQGELMFDGCTPLKGLRIIAEERFITDRLLKHTGALELLGKTTEVLAHQLLLEKEIRVVLAQIITALKRGVSFSLYYECKLMELLLLRAEVATKPSRQQQDPQSVLAAAIKEPQLAIVRTAQRLLRENLANPPSIKELAIATATSPSKLRQDFKAACNCTPHDYLQEQRMVKALELMHTTTYPLYQIAQEVGFTKAGYFSQVFKQRFGMSPREYIAKI